MKNKVRLAGIIQESVVDGPGIRIAIFMQGCLHNCLNCHNPKTWDLNGGKEYDLDYIDDIIKNNPYTDGITITGGDPFYQLDALNEILKLINDKYKLNTIVYTGFAYEELLEMISEHKVVLDILKKIDILIDGKFDYERRDLSLLYRGSSNQRVIDVKKSLRENKVVTTEF